MAMVFRRGFFIVLLLGCMVVESAEANFYRATVPVKSQDAKERKLAAQRGLQEVLVRMSGSSKILENAAIRQSVAKASRYIEQFQYERLEDEKITQEGYKTSLVLTFSPSVVKRILTQAGQAFWPENRPQALLWIVEDDSQYGKQLLNGESGKEIIEYVGEFASKRGLPIAYPLLDLQDQIALSADDVWLLEEEKILAASQRYRADVILVGRFSYTSGGEIWATWQFFHDRQTRVYDSRTRDFENLGELALTPLIEHLAGRYGILQQQREANSNLIMQLSGVENFENYRKVLDYFEGLAVVGDVKLSAVRRDTLLIEVKSTTTLDRFTRALELDKRVELIEDEQLSALPAWQRPLPGTMENPLRYAWK